MMAVNGDGGVRRGVGSVTDDAEGDAAAAARRRGGRECVGMGQRASTSSPAHVWRRCGRR